MNKFYDRKHDLYKAALLTRCYTQHALRPCNYSEINHIRHFIEIPFINKGIEFIDLPSIFRDNNDISAIPSYFEKMASPIICYKCNKKKVREKSRECHNHKPQPFPDPKRKRKPTNLNKHKPNKRTKSTKISSLFPKRGNRNTKRTEKHKNKMTHGKTYNKSPRRINHKETRSKTNTGTTALERSVKPIRNTILNLNELVSHLDIETSSPDSWACNDSKFCYQPAGHIVTGNLKIITDSRIRSVISEGPKYRFPAHIDFNKCRETIASALNYYCTRWCKREHVESNALNN